MYEKSDNGLRTNYVYLFFDTLAMVIATLVMHGFAFRMHQVDSPFPSMKLLLLIAALPFIVIFLSENYRMIDRRGYYIEFIKTLKMVLLVFFVFITFFFMMEEDTGIGRSMYFYWLILCVILVYIARTILKLLRKNTYRTSMKRVLFLITDKEGLDDSIDKIKSDLFNEYHLSAVGVLDQENCSDDSRWHLVCGSVGAMLDYAIDNVVDEVLITSIPYNPIVKDLINDLKTMGITVHYYLSDLFVGIDNSHVQKLGSMNVITTSNSFVSERDLFLKRLLDVTGSVIGLMITGILIVIIGPIIYITSPGPIIFKQKRVGKNGRIFDFYKFRSMYADAEERKKELMAKNEMDGLMFKMENDPRITPIGRILRKTSIDEFPQFWNIMKGDMSLVGTRPPTLDEYEKYDKHHKSRLAMRPGLTGMWQVAGRNEIKDFEDVVRLDRKYIDNWTIGLDFRLLLQTVKVVVVGRGAK